MILSMRSVYLNSNISNILNTHLLRSWQGMAKHHVNKTYTLKYLKFHHIIPIFYELSCTLIFRVPCELRTPDFARSRLPNADRRLIVFPWSMTSLSHFDEDILGLVFVSD